jgi:hypothetical protein
MSQAYGEVVVPLINIFERPGFIFEHGELMASLPHGTRFTLCETVIDRNQNRTFFKIKSGDVEGWVLDSFVSNRWSCFTFLGKLIPAQVCEDLELSHEYGGMIINIRNNGFAIITEGDPADFDCIKKAVTSFKEKMATAQAPLSLIPIDAVIEYWVEMPSEYSKGQRTVGFMSSDESITETIVNDDLKRGFSIADLMFQEPYLDLSLSDFDQALRNPQHALIFLSRSIESIETYFSGIAKCQNKKGKEDVMRELLGLKKSYVDYVTKRANASHRRHASKTGDSVPLPQDEFIECFTRTVRVIGSFINYLRNLRL